MATKQGKRFGVEKGIQRNKDEEPGQRKANRSPGQSNANRLAPSLRENVVPSQTRDVGRISQGMNATGRSALTRSAQQQAGGRALIRTAGRAGAVGAAAMVGYAVGSEIAESSQASKEKRVAERESFKDVMNRPESAPKQAAKKVSMSDMPKAAPAPKVAPETAPKAKAAASPAPKMQERGVREGPNENVGDDTRARAMASVADLEDVNKKNKWKGVME